jgi:hypothetical protein
MPHDFIFNRDWYELFEGKAELEDYRTAYGRLSDAQRIELVNLLSSCDPREFASLATDCTDSRLKAALQFYIPVPKDELVRIWAKQKKLIARDKKMQVGLADDEIVEDAGLEAEEVAFIPPTKAKAESKNQRSALQ